MKLGIDHYKITLIQKGVYPITISIITNKATIKNSNNNNGDDDNNNK